MKYHTLKPSSARGRLKGVTGDLHLKLLRLQRGNKCEISGDANCVVGRFHILRVSSHPRLEFESENILLCRWFPEHYAWHHNGANDLRNAKTLARIKELKGEDYEEKLLKIEATKQRHDMLYLEALKLYLKSEIGRLNKETEIKLKKDLTNQSGLGKI